MIKTNQAWGGRFAEPTDEFVKAFTASVLFDQRMAMQDIQGSKAHATMLAEVGVLTSDEKDAIVQGLEQVAQTIAKGEFVWSVDREDVHMNVEAALIEQIGEVGKKLHTGRSRNDQVATDIRLYLRDAIDDLQGHLRWMQTSIVQLAEQHTHTIMPGFTHLQTAQPVTFGHHLMAWYEMLKRDEDRLLDLRKRVNILPLGSAALAGTTYPINRHRVAELLGFAEVSENSLDGVSDRDFAIEFTAFASMLMMHLSRMSEELVLWTSAQFNFVRLPDRYCTGSSIMPQKKNPDVPELVRGKTGRVYGHLMGLLTLMKSQPLAYNKDNQEDKEPLFDTLDTVKNSLRAFADMIPHIQANSEAMRQATLKGYATATDLADYLVKKGLPFRDAHEVVGSAVALAVKKSCDLAELSLDELQGFSSLIGEEVFAVLTLEGCVNARNHWGGTAPNQVQAAVQRAKTRLVQP